MSITRPSTSADFVYDYYAPKSNSSSSCTDPTNTKIKAVLKSRMPSQTTFEQKKFPIYNKGDRIQDWRPQLGTKNESNHEIKPMSGTPVGGKVVVEGGFGPIRGKVSYETNDYGAAKNGHKKDDKPRTDNEKNKDTDKSAGSGKDSGCMIQ